MENRVLAVELKNNDGKEVEVAGWVHTIRSMGKLTFIHIRDRSGRLQAIVKGDLMEKAKTLGLEDVVLMKGKVKLDEKVVNGAELQVEKIEVISSVGGQKLPVDVAGKTETSLDTRFDHRTLDLRREKMQAVFKIQSTICQAFREFYVSKNFVEIHTPKIISTGTEGGANLFKLPYFGREAFLAQSPQFYKQMLVGSGFERVFEISPVFRAEEHDTPFHLNEYVSMDVEMGFIEDEEDVLKIAEEMFKFIFQKVKEKNANDLKTLGIELSIPTTPFPRILHWEIPQILKKYGKEVAEDVDLNRELEQLLCKYAMETAKSDFVIVKNYPNSLRPGYTMPLESNKKFTRGFDILFKGMEIISGGQRVHQYELLKERFKEKGFNPDDFEFYFEAFKYGMPPHGGFAIGLERLTMKMLNLESAKDAAFFPRDKKRIYP